MWTCLLEEGAHFRRKNGVLVLLVLLKSPAQVLASLGKAAPQGLPSSRPTRTVLSTLGLSQRPACSISVFPSYAAK